MNKNHNTGTKIGSEYALLPFLLEKQDNPTLLTIVQNVHKSCVQLKTLQLVYFSGTNSLKSLTYMNTESCASG